MKVVAVHALIECICDICGGACHRIGLAEVLPDGRIGEGRRVDADQVISCNDCTKREREEEADRVRKQNRRIRWAAKAMSRFPKGRAQ